MRQPAAIRRFALRDDGEIALLRLAPRGRQRAFDFRQRSQNAVARDLPEIIPGHGREPLRHIQL